jgi:hypothetical protein
LPFICVHQTTPPSAPWVLPGRSLVDLLQPKMVPGCVLLLPGDPCILGVPGSSMVDLLQPKVVQGASWCPLVLLGARWWSLGAPWVLPALWWIYSSQNWFQGASWSPWCSLVLPGAPLVGPWLIYSSQKWFQGASWCPLVLPLVPRGS